MKFTRVFLGFGSNVGVRESHLNFAFETLQCNKDVQILQQSSVIETEPVGDIDQGKFLNQVIHLETEFEPEQLLEICLEIEQSRGRIRAEKWGPRTLDIDILFYGNLQIHTSELTIPHPEVHKRSFMLIPLLEIAPWMKHPSMNFSIEEMLCTL